MYVCESVCASRAFVFVLSFVTQHTQQHCYRHYHKQLSYAEYQQNQVKPFGNHFMFTDILDD